MDEFVSLLSIPNVSRDRENIQKNADAIVRMLEKRKIPARLVSVAGSNPVVLGEIKTPGATRTIVFYAHYDGQPLDPKEWADPPFQPSASRWSRRERRQDDRAAGRGQAVQSRMALVRALRRRRQGADHRDADGASTRFELPDSR